MSFISSFKDVPHLCKHTYTHTHTHAYIMLDIHSLKEFRKYKENSLNFLTRTNILQKTKTADTFECYKCLLQNTFTCAWCEPKCMRQQHSFFSRLLLFYFFRWRTCTHFRLFVQLLNRDRIFYFHYLFSFFFKILSAHFMRNVNFHLWLSIWHVCFRYVVFLLWKPFGKFLRYFCFVLWIVSVIQRGDTSSISFFHSSLRP